MTRFSWPHSNDYPVTLKHQRTTLHLQKELPTLTRQALKRMIDLTPDAKRVSAPLECASSRLFTKRERLDSFRQKWRVQHGTRKRNGMFDWSLEELVNTCEANRRGARVPGLVGFGYSRSKVGLIDDVFLITHRLDGYLDGYNWILAHPQAVNQLLDATFELLHALHAQGITHMDLWAANVMLPEQVGKPAMAIDLENSFSVPTAFFSETLAFQFGFFYYRHIYRFITEIDYDAKVKQAVERYFPQIREADFKRVYEIAKHQDIGRLKRRDIFLEGKIESLW